MFAECDEYSLRVLICVAEEAMQQSTIQEKTKIPAQQLPAIIDMLIQAQLIRLDQGLYHLIPDPKELSLYDALNAIKGWQRWSSCPLEVDDHSEELCPLHRRLENISALVERQLRASTVASLLSDPSQQRPLCNKLQ